MNQDSFPIILPSEELVLKWDSEWHAAKVKHMNYANYIATQAANWGADQELKACCEWVAEMTRFGDTGWVHNFHTARRPKPPSLKEQAKFAAAVLRSPDETCSIAELQQHWHTICNALEQLND